MKKMVPLFLVLLIVAFTVPAMAYDFFGGGSCDPYTSTLKIDEVFKINYDFDKDKDINIHRTVRDRFTTYSCNTLYPTGRADAEVVKKQINEKNDFDSPKTVAFSDLITGAFQFTGIGQANQSAGFMNNQANVVNAAVSSKHNPYLSAEVTDIQINDGNKLTYNQDPSLPATPQFSDKIASSFNNFHGVGQANQAASFGNNQNNVVNVAFGIKGALIATSDVVLEQVNINNKLSGLTNVKSACEINTAFTGFTGIGQVNQSSGSFNNQTNVVSFAGSRACN